MSASTLYARNTVAQPPAAPTMARLSALELRKATDTRAGRWLLLLIFLAGAVTAIVTALAGKAPGHTLSAILGNSDGAVSLLLPVLGVMLVTSEWSQRTALTTFTLVPRRGRVIVAKIIAGLLLAVAAAVVCDLLALGATAIASHAVYPDPWQAAPALLGRALVFQALNVLLGLGIGLLFLNTPVAVVVYFALPTAWSILTGTIHALHSTGNWLNPNTAWGHLSDTTVPALTVARIATAAAVWVLLPMIAGYLRVRRASIS